MAARVPAVAIREILVSAIVSVVRDKEDRAKVRQKTLLNLIIFFYSMHL